MAMTTVLSNPRVAAPTLHGLPAARVVLGSGIGMATNFGPILIYTFGTFLLPIAQETGWSRAAVATALAPAALLSGLMQPLVGRLIDRFGPRRFAAVSFALFALGLVLLGLAPQSAAMFAVCMGLLGLLGAGQSITGFTYIVASRFNQRRGLALGLVNVCSAASIMVMPAVATGLIAGHGWRGAYAAMGVGVAVLGAIAVLWLIPGQDADRTERARPLPWSRVLAGLAQDKVFWALAAAFLLMTIAVQGVVVHFTPLLVDRGYRPAEAAGVMAVYGVTMLVARFVLGALLDTRSPRLIAILGCLGPLVACAMLAEGTTGPWVLVAAALVGFGAGAESDLLPYTVSRHFGRERLGQVLGVFIVVFAIGVALGPVLFARVQAAFGSYRYALFASSVLMLAAIALFATIRSDAMTRVGERAAP